MDPNCPTARVTRFGSLRAHAIQQSMDGHYTRALDRLGCTDFSKLSLAKDVLTAAINTDQNDGMDEPVVNSEEATPGHGPLLTWSQFENTVHSSADMNLQGDEFT